MFTSNKHPVIIKNHFTAGDVQVFINNDPKSSAPPNNGTSGPHEVKHNDVIKLGIPSKKRFRFRFTGAGKTYTYKDFFLKGENQEIKVLYNPPRFSLLSWIRRILTRGPDNIGVGPDEP